MQQKKKWRKNRKFINNWSIEKWYKIWNRTYGENWSCWFHHYICKIIGWWKNIKPKGKALTLDVTAKNESDKKVLLASTEFTLYKNGKKQESYFGETNHLDGNLDRNKTVKGVLQYDVEGAGEYELIYKPAYINDKKEYKWHIEVK